MPKRIEFLIGDQEIELGPKVRQTTFLRGVPPKIVERLYAASLVASVDDSVGEPIRQRDPYPSDLDLLLNTLLIQSKSHPEPKRLTWPATLKLERQLEDISPQWRWKGILTPAERRSRVLIFAARLLYLDLEWQGEWRAKQDDVPQGFLEDFRRCNPPNRTDEVWLRRWRNKFDGTLNTEPTNFLWVFNTLFTNHARKKNKFFSTG